MKAGGGWTEKGRRMERNGMWGGGDIRKEADGGDGKEDRKGNGMRDEEVDDWERGGWERMRERG